MYRPRVEPFLAVWEDPFDQRVLRLIRERPGIPREALRRQVVPDSRPLERSLSRLLACGAIRMKTSDVGRRFWSSADWRKFEKLCLDGVPDRLQRFLDLLESEGLHPVLEEVSTDRVRMSVDGPRFRIRFALPLNPVTRDERA